MTSAVAGQLGKHIASWGPRLLLGMVCALALILSFGFLRETIRYSYLTSTADQLRHGGKIGDARLAEIAASLTALRQGGTCRSDIVKPAIGLLLLNVDRQSTSADDDLWRDILGDAEQFLRFGLRCLPMDGDIWLRLAMIRALEGALPEEVATLFNTSQQLAPVHPDVLKARLQFWPTLAPAAQQLSLMARTTDLATLCSASGRPLQKDFPGSCPAGK